MFATKQDLLSVKEENLKLKQNFKKFLKKHEQNKKYITKDKVKEFMEEQETLIDNLNKKIDKIIDENKNTNQGTDGALPQKRKRSGILNFEHKARVSKRSRMDPEQRWGL